ncbi:uncharacterized protein LOC122255178 [Penaeus japonicus]|uniref:uncharacterized protein LOC122255178 n=1 Tax=Penaeus japonicus TaxID=27405 RepID=UPI001C710C24|nr:uncharacterized protein LOC122255178 [Penaeus japonicus]
MDKDSLLTILRSEKDLSTSWLEKLMTMKLKRDVRVTSWTARVPEEKDGCLSEISFVHVEYQDSSNQSKKQSLVFKFMPRDKHLIEFMKCGNLARKEIEFYKLVATEDFQLFCERTGLRHPVPDVYWSFMKDDLLTLVMHDLSTDDFRVDIPLEGNHLLQTKATLHSIAVIHAWGIASLKKYGKGFFNVPSKADFLGDFFTNGLEKQIEIFQGTPTEQTLKAIQPLSEDLIKMRSPFFDTVIHGDLWAGNVLFSPDDATAAIIDWQFACVDNPACDLVTMLLISSHPEVLRRHLTEVLESYWQALTNDLRVNGAAVEATLQDLMDSVEEMWMYGYMFYTVSLIEMMANEKTNVDRLRCIVTFLEERGAFKKFLQKNHALE